MGVSSIFFCLLSSLLALCNPSSPSGYSLYRKGTPVGFVLVRLPVRVNTYFLLSLPSVCPSLPLYRLFKSPWYSLRLFRSCFQVKETQLALGKAVFPLPTSLPLLSPLSSLSFPHSLLSRLLPTAWQDSHSSARSQCLHARNKAPPSFLSFSSLSLLCHCPNMVLLISNTT